MNDIKCVFSGEEPDTREHIIPSWLQKRFGLQGQTYHLPNSTSLDYIHAKVPARSHDNGQFGKIEERISGDKFVWEEVFLWLFKIHVGLLYLDTELPHDRTAPNSAPIAPTYIFRNQIKLFRELYRQYFLDGKFISHASPPGSVFILPSLAPGKFDLAHSFPCGTVGVNIGKFFLAASLWDFGMAKNYGYFDWNWNKNHFGSPSPDFDDEVKSFHYLHTQKIWLCGLGYWSFRWNINMYRIRNDYQPSMPAFDGEPVQRPEQPEELEKFCQSFGLKLIEFIPNGKSRFSQLNHDID